MAFGVGICARRCLSSSLPMLLASLLKADLYLLSKDAREEGRRRSTYKNSNLPHLAPDSYTPQPPACTLTYVHVVLAHSSHCQE